MTDKYQQLVDALRGSTEDAGLTCGRFGLDPNDPSVWERIDDQIFMCSACHQWCGVEDDVGFDEQTCIECVEDS